MGNLPPDVAFALGAVAGAVGISMLWVVGILRWANSDRPRRTARPFYGDQILKD